MREPHAEGCGQVIAVMAGHPAGVRHLNRRLGSRSDGTAACALLVSGRLGPAPPCAAVLRCTAVPHCEKLPSVGRPLIDRGCFTAIQPPCPRDLCDQTHGVMRAGVPWLASTV